MSYRSLYFGPNNCVVWDNAVQKTFGYSDLIKNKSWRISSKIILLGNKTDLIFIFSCKNDIHNWHCPLLPSHGVHTRLCVFLWYIYSVKIWLTFIWNTFDSIFRTKCYHDESWGRLKVLNFILSFASVTLYL